MLDVREKTEKRSKRMMLREIVEATPSRSIRRLDILHIKQIKK
jgi:hypothetical protein